MLSMTCVGFPECFLPKDARYPGRMNSKQEWRSAREFSTSEGRKRPEAMRSLKHNRDNKNVDIRRMTRVIQHFIRRVITLTGTKSIA